MRYVKITVPNDLLIDQIYETIEDALEDAYLPGYVEIVGRPDPTGRPKEVHFRNGRPRSSEVLAEANRLLDANTSPTEICSRMNRTAWSLRALGKAHNDERIRKIFGTLANRQYRRSLLGRPLNDTREYRNRATV